ncbi:MAG: hypothetical protein A2806_02640 [Candidatus Terrybacteria bacterium RIFCSPHIGHO2_01_FULL_48_17]|uniref:Uncharacterized protein n=1 Tax=Candidatus Terrybacteria bacterium RIFCSPHIGHO2_01_FULL_48_17 TaxID=1802362 RepID=A0A1G2PI31_9BACT|nr:MAG: hypothetical protein A2806_02640 [Candidatus Terrybacteria bacterium RIFCSPHIGHO2_01_FULL_48_17]OHA52080.1 MAG: hypothetical protein A3A30_04180 [Candidatus Terrybacteria bacterium RIFCSPLOWO2_01_FULL_48_14]
MDPNANNELPANAKPQGGILAAVLGAVTAILSIGAFHIVAEANDGFKNFLKLHEGVGPLSGKVVFGYIAGLVIFAIAFGLLHKKKRVNIVFLFFVLLTALMLGTLFVFTPFVKLLVD